jgi:hypothetical protein
MKNKIRNVDNSRFSFATYVPCPEAHECLGKERYNWFNRINTELFKPSVWLDE